MYVVGVKHRKFRLSQFMLEPSVVELGYFLAIGSRMPPTYLLGCLWCTCARPTCAEAWCTWGKRHDFLLCRVQITTSSPNTRTGNIDPSPPSSALPTVGESLRSPPSFFLQRSLLSWWVSRTGGCLKIKIVNSSDGSGMSEKTPRRFGRHERSNRKGDVPALTHFTK